MHAEPSFSKALSIAQKKKARLSDAQRALSVPECGPAL